MEPIRAERATVTFFEGLTVDGYRLPNGEFRVGLEGASKVVGYQRDWLPQAFRRGGRTLKALEGMGFTSLHFTVTVPHTGRSGASTPETISLKDFVYVIAYASSKGKKAAIALQSALVEMSLNDFFRDAFGERPLSVSEKRRLFYEAYAATISPEEWRRMDREEILKLALPGDEPQLKDWNR